MNKNPKWGVVVKVRDDQKRRTAKKTVVVRVDEYLLPAIKILKAYQKIEGKAEILSTI